MDIEGFNMRILESYDVVHRASQRGQRAEGTRSTQKLIPIHSYLGEGIKSIWGKDFSVNYIDQHSSKEARVHGKYYAKRVDIAIGYCGQPVFCLGMKFPLSDFGKNSNNYFENMLGETANLQANKIPYAQIIIARHPYPQYDRNYRIISHQDITRVQLEKYRKLVLDAKSAHKPSYFCLHIVRIIDEPRSIATVALTDLYPDDKRKHAEDLMKRTSFTGLVEFIRQHKHSEEVREICTRYGPQDPPLFP